MLKVERVAKSFPPRQVLQGVSLNVDSEIRVIIGLNGGGKSTCTVAIKIQTKSCLEGNTFALCFLVQQGLDESPDLFLLG